MTTTWKQLNDQALHENQETFGDVISCTLTEDQLNRKFDSALGETEGDAFTAWTANRVYFPLCYDGSEWAGSVARNPNGKPTDHQGGG